MTAFFVETKQPAALRCPVAQVALTTISARPNAVVAVAAALSVVAVW